MELKTDTGVWGASVFFTQKESVQQPIVYFNSGGGKKRSDMILANPKKEN